MSGKHNGVQAIIKRDAPEALYVHCKALCLNLAVVHACKEPTVRTMMAVVQECGFAFHYPAKRLEAFISELQDDVHVQEAMQRKTKNSARNKMDESFRRTNDLQKCFACGSALT